jgi:integrase
MHATTALSPNPRPGQHSPAGAPTFREFAWQWWDLNTAHLAPATVTDYLWRLDNHLFPWFGEMPLDQITTRDIDEYKVAKLRDGALVARSINMTLILLCSILDDAIEQEWIATNPARGRRRRLPTGPPKRTLLESAEQIQALLDAAEQLDRQATPQGRHVQRRAIIATLLFSGLRIGELCQLAWGDVDLDGGWLHVRRSKTPAGIRQIRIRPALEAELRRARDKASGTNPESPVFPTSTGFHPHQANIRDRVLKPAAALARTEVASFPEGITPHSLRRTFASLLFAIGEPHPVVMLEMGHTSPSMTLGVYAKAMRRDEGERAALCQLLTAPAQLSAPS